MLMKKKNGNDRKRTHNGTSLFTIVAEQLRTSKMPLGEAPLTK
jgi:hypothetical protein